MSCSPPSVPGREEECDLSGELERSQSGPFGALHHLGELHSLTNVVVISTPASNTYDMKKLKNKVVPGSYI